MQPHRFFTRHFSMPDVVLQWQLVEQLLQRLYFLQSLKYSLPDPLWKKTANPGTDYSLEIFQSQLIKTEEFWGPASGRPSSPE